MRITKRFGFRDHALVVRVSQPIEVLAINPLDAYTPCARLGQKVVEPVALFSHQDSMNAPPTGAQRLDH